MKFWFILIIISTFISSSRLDVVENKGLNLKWSCDDKNMDEAIINFNFSNNILDWNNETDLVIKYQYTECNKCYLIDLITLTSTDNYRNNIIIDSYYAYKFQVITSTNETICDTFVYESFKECGNYLFEIEKDNKCKIYLKNKLPFDSVNYLYIALVVAILLTIIYNLVVYLYKRLRKVKIQSNNDFELKENTSIERDTITNEKSIKNKKTRLECLDTFRGLSLVLMIFVNYGAGGYKSIEHKPWHGIALADFVFPWFVWIMGVSLVISLNSQLEKQNKKECLKRIVIRFIKLFVLGLVLTGFYGVYLSKLRILNVLQRIALCYLFIAVLEVVFYSKNIKNYLIIENKYKKYFIDLIWSWKHWLVILLVLTIWLLITYLLPVPDCGAGYLGPGGLDNFGKYEKCTGGATGYIDAIILGENHVYKWPTCQEIYKTGAFDPEGILGTLNTIFSSYLGVQAGRIFIFYKKPKQRIFMLLIWGLITFILFGLLTFFDLENGPIPVNKNLWTITFSLITASSAFFILSVLYFIIDVKKWWDGGPIVYPGMNSIVIYACHNIFGTAFPVQWLVANTHGVKLALHVWGAVFWTGVGTYLYYKKFSSVYEVFLFLFLSCFDKEDFKIE